MEKARNNPVLFWKIGWSLMRSTSFVTMATQKILFGWHRKYPYWKVLKTANRVLEIARSRDSNLDYKRVYIPKPGDQ